MNVTLCRGYVGTNYDGKSVNTMIVKFITL